MILSSKLFGTGEFALRLPNVLAHAGYLFFTALLALRYRNIILVLSAFLLLNVNPFILDFFSVARGYGISLCFLAGSLYYLSKALSSEVFEMRYVLLSLLLAIPGILANLTLLNYLLALTGILLLTVAYRTSPLPGKLLRKRCLPVLLITGLTLIFFIPVVMKLKASGTLFYGGETGFWPDTVTSLIMTTFRKGEVHDIASVSIICVLSIAAIICLYRLVRKRTDKEHMMLSASLLLILVCAMGSILQNYLLGTKFLLDRTAIFFIPLFMLVLCEVLFVSCKLPFLRWAAPVAVIPFVINFNSIANLRSVVIWEYDADTRSMVNKLEEQYKLDNRKGMLNVSSVFIYEPALTYYKVTRNLAWLNKINYQPEKRQHMDYCLLPWDEPAAPGAMVLDTFPSRARLYKNTVQYNWKPLIKIEQRFENEDIMHELTSSEQVRSGKYSGVLDPEHGASLSIDQLLSSTLIKSIVRLHVKADVFIEDKSSNINLITSTQSSETVTHFDIIPVRDHVTETGKWSTLNWIQFIPQPLSDDLLKVYFLGDKNSKAFFDNLEVTAYIIAEDQ